MFKKILEQLRSVPVIDSHTHIMPEHRQAKDMLAAYTGQYLGHDLITAGMPKAAFAMLSNTEIPYQKRFLMLEPWLQKIKHTAYYRCMDKSIRSVLGVGGLTAETLTDAVIAFEKRPSPGFYDLLFNQCKIESVLIDHTGFDWEYDGSLYVQAYNTIHLFAPYNEKLLESIETLSGVRIRGFDSYLAACEALIRAKVSKQGVRVLKFPIAYMRDLSFPQSGYSQAETEFNKVFSNRIQYRDGISSTYSFDSCPLFQNYLMHRLMGVAENLNLTCQFHTGFLAGHHNYLPNSRPTQLIPLIYQYPGVRFDLFHMAYPYQSELGVMAKNFPNVFVNLCWAHIISPAAVCSALYEWLDILPANKIIGFGSDLRAVDLIAGSLEMARENTARVLSRRIEDGLMSLCEAEALAHTLLYDNPKALYYL